MPGVTLKHRLLAVVGAPLLGLGFAVVAAAGLLLWVLLAPAKYLLRDAAGRRELAREGAVTLWVFLLVDSAFVGPAALGYALWGGGGLWLQVAAAAYVAWMLGDQRAFTGRGKPFLRELG